MERIVPIGKLNLKLQYETQIHVVIVMHIYLLRELYQLHQYHHQQQTQIIMIKKQHCAPFTDCVSEIKNTEIDNGKEINVVMPMYDLKEYSGNYAKKLGNLQQYYIDKPFLDGDNASADFPAANKQKITGKTAHGGTKEFEIMVLLNYLTNFCGNS